MTGMFKNESLMAENSSRILKWFVWLSSFGFEIVHKPGYLNCLADMLTSESAIQKQPKALNMFSAGDSSSGADEHYRDPDKGKAPLTEEEIAAEEEEIAAAMRKLTHEELLKKEGLFILPWDNTFPKEVCIQSLEYASTEEAKRFLQLTLIK